MVMTLSDRERTRRHVAALEGALGAVEAAPDAPLVFYPTWRNRDLGVHLVAVHTMAAAAIETAATARPTVDVPVDVTSPVDAIIRAAHAASQRLDAALATTALTEVWALLPGRHPRAWRRRMLCEALLHRFDATQALGEPAVPDAEEARDAVDEFLGVHLRRGLIDADLATQVEVRTDTGWWQLDLATGALGVTAGRPRSGDPAPGVTVTGEPVALWAWLNRRAHDGLPEVEVDDRDGTAGALLALLDGLGRPA